MEFIQNNLAQDFGFPHDKVLESLEECLKRLQVLLLFFYFHSSRIR